MDCCFFRKATNPWDLLHPRYDLRLLLTAEGGFFFDISYLKSSDFDCTSMRADDIRPYISSCRLSREANPLIRFYSRLFSAGVGADIIRPHDSSCIMKAQCIVENIQTRVFRTGTFLKSLCYTVRISNIQFHARGVTARPI